MKTTWTGFFSLISSRLVILLLLGVQPWCWFTNLTLIIWITLFTLKSKLRSSTVCVNSLLLTFEAVLLPTKIHLHMFFRKGTCWNGRCWGSHSRNVPSTSYSSELKFAMCWFISWCLSAIFLLNGRWCHRAYTVNEVLRHISWLWLKYIITNVADVTWMCTLTNRKRDLFLKLRIITWTNTLFCYIWLWVRVNMSAVLVRHTWLII